MLLDAFKAEFYRFSKNRMTAFWSLAFVPLILVLGGSLITWFIINKTKALEATLPVAEKATTSTFAQDLMALSEHSANVAMIGFLLIGAATVFAGDYRWETWRLISARNSRLNLLGGKVFTLLLMIAIAILGLMIGGTIVLLFANAYEGTFSGIRLNDIDAGQMGLFLLLGLVRLFQVSMLALLAAVITRSLMAALFAPIIISIAQSFAEKAVILLQIMPTDWRAIFLSPGLAFTHLSTALKGGLPPAIADDVIRLSLGSVVAWIVVPLILALFLFQRQDMSKE